VIVTVTPWYYTTFYCFEACSNDLALSVSRFYTDVSFSDN